MEVASKILVDKYGLLTHQFHGGGGCLVLHYDPSVP